MARLRVELSRLSDIISRNRDRFYRVKQEAIQSKELAKLAMEETERLRGLLRQHGIEDRGGNEE